MSRRFQTKTGSRDTSRRSPYIQLQGQDRSLSPDTAYNHEPNAGHDQKRSYSTRFQKLFRALGLKLLFNFWLELRKKPVQEPPKTALRKDWRTAFISGLVHLIPMSASLVIVILNWRGYYIGGELAGISGQDTDKFLALQFAAKLHELAIVASLTAVIFSFVRHELVEDSGMPFGALTAGLQFKDISFLWSMEFWGILSSHWKKTRNKCALIFLIIICGILAVSVGPASATLMKPRMDQWPAGGTDFWISMPSKNLLSTNISAKEVDPRCSVDTGLLSCPSVGWQAVAQTYMSRYAAVALDDYLPDTIQFSSGKAVRELRAYQRNPGFQFALGYALGSISFSSVADAVVDAGRLWCWAAFRVKNQRFSSRVDAGYSVAAPMPIVHARCFGFSQNMNDTLFSQFRSGQFTFYDLWDLDHHVHGDFPKTHFNHSGGDQIGSLLQNINLSTQPQIAWLTIPQANLTNSTLGALLVVPQPNNETSILACTLDPRLRPSTVNSTRGQVSVVKSDWAQSTYDNDNTFPRISIDPAWATYLNPTIQSSNKTVFQETMQSSGLWASKYNTKPSDAAYIGEVFLAITLANGLSRRDFGTTISGTLLGKSMSGFELTERPVADHDDPLPCDDWCKEILPKLSNSMGTGGNAFNISNAEEASSTKFTMNAAATGYAYSARGSAAKFSIFALLFYCAIALAHWVYTAIYNRESSNSWDSISELIALAMNSDRSIAFRNTGAGIDSCSVFKNPVRIIARVIDNDETLQLAVGSPREPYHQVLRDELYG